MKNYFKIFFSVFVFICLTSTVYAVIRGTAFTTYRKFLLPYEYDPYFINSLEHCIPKDYVDWDGVHKYIIIGKENNICRYKSQYNPWLKTNKNEWRDYKECFFNDAQLLELTNAMKEEGYKKENEISTYAYGAYKVTGTKVEYLLSNYEYYGTCKLIKKKK